MAVAAPGLLREDLRPCGLRIVENERDELNEGLLALVARRIGLAYGRASIATAHAQQGEEIAVKHKAEQEQNNRAADADVASANAAAPAIVATIFYVRAFTTGRPSHGFNL